jgi:hypothetical protein
MRAKMVSKDVGVGENGVKTLVIRKYSLAWPRAKLWSKCLWVGKSCWGKGMEFEHANKA